MAELLDVTHALILEGSDPSTRHEADDAFERMGHEVRASTDEAYKRATWGKRPEDIEAIKSLTGDMAGRR